MLLKNICAAAVLTLSGMAAVHAADTMHDFNFKEAVDRAVADGTLDGSVKFYLTGTKSGGKVIEKGLVTNKKTNGFAKSAESACDHVLRSALIQFQNTAKAKGANAVTNLVVALKGDIVKF